MLDNLKEEAQNHDEDGNIQEEAEAMKRWIEDEREARGEY